MSNTEINSLFEITKSLENKGLYLQADRAHNVMLRLSQGGMYFQSGYGSQGSDKVITPALKKTKETLDSTPELVKQILQEVASLTFLFTFFKASGFIPAIKKALPMIISKAGKGFALKALWDILHNLVEVSNLASEVDWGKVGSGILKSYTGDNASVDTKFYDIIDKILNILCDICFVASHYGVVILEPWFGVFWALKTAFNKETAENLGYWAGGMPGGAKQIEQIEKFSLQKIKDSTESLSSPYAQKVVTSILADMPPPGGLPKTLGLDFFIPYINKYDTEKRFKDLTSSNPSVETMELKLGLFRIVDFLREKSTTKK